MDGSMLATLGTRAGRTARKKVTGLRSEEAAVLTFLQQRLMREARKRRKAA
jgi:hypothetical protein